MRPLWTGTARLNGHIQWFWKGSNSVLNSVLYHICQKRNTHLITDIWTFERESTADYHQEWEEGENYSDKIKEIQPYP